MAQKRVIAMISDFGLSDHFVAVMKAVILNINPDAMIMDITHNIERHDVLDAGLKLFQSYKYFPPKTIFLCVVDPGVGTDRRVLTCSDGEFFYIAPDNGLLSFIYRENPKAEVYNVSYTHYFLESISNTFQGRDIFAPLAAHMSKGLYPADTGEQIIDFKKIMIPDCSKEREDLLSGVIIGFDTFGNAVTNIRNDAAGEEFGAKILDHIIQKASKNYEEGLEKSINMIKGSSGFLELFVRNGNCKNDFNLKRGMKLIVKIK